MLHHFRSFGKFPKTSRQSTGRKNRCIKKGPVRNGLSAPEQLEARIVLDSTVVFNEIMYHTDNDDSLEFVELYNQNSVDMDLSGWRLSGGVDYTFPEGTVLDGGEYLVIANDPVAFQSSTGFNSALGPFTGLLSNGGETINLRSNNDRLMDTLDYSDGGDWPVGADGSGSSLAKLQRLTASEPAANWATSAQVGGTPGGINFVDDSVTLPQNVDLIDSDTPVQVLVPTVAESGLGTTWTEQGFSTAGWISGDLGVGFDSDISSTIDVPTVDRYYTLDGNTNDTSGNDINGSIMGSGTVSPAPNPVGASHDGLFFTEDFSSNTVGAHLNDAGPTFFNAGVIPDNISYAGGNATWDPGALYRRYIGTNETNYNEIDFTFEATVTFSSVTTGGWEIAFMGMGNTTPGTFFGEISAPNVELFVWPNNPTVRGDVENAAGPINSSSAGITGPALGSTNRLRMSWDATNKIAYYEIDAGNDGSFETAWNLDASATELNNTNSQLYFGGGDSAVWDDIEVKAFTPPVVVLPNQPTHVLPSTTNIALGDTVVYTSSEYSGAFLGQHVTDGSINDVFGINYWIEADGHVDPSGDQANFILDLGQAENITTLGFLNTHNDPHNDRGTLLFRVEASNSFNGTNDLVGATTILTGTLSNVAGQNPITPDVFDSSNGLTEGSYRYLKFVTETAVNSNAGLNEMLVYSSSVGNFYSSDVPAAISAHSTDSFLFNGIDDKVTINDATDPSAYTISAWVKPAVIGEQNIIVRTDGDPTTNFSHQLRMTAAGQFEAFTNDGSGKTVTGTTLASADTWYHVLVTADNNGMMRLYVNGTEEGTAVAIGTLDTSGNQWQVGAEAGTAAQYSFFTGQVDDLAIWHEVLPSADITLLKDGASPADITEEVIDIPSAAGLDRYYPLDTDADDDSGNNLNGTVSGATFAVDTPPLLTSSSGSLLLDGVDDRAIINDTTHPIAYTISAWVKPNSIKAQSIVVRTAGDPLTTWSHQIRMTAAGTFEAYTFDGGVKTVTGTTTAVAGQWYHVVATALNNGEMKLYVNGVEEGTAQPVATLWAAGTQWQIGSNSGNLMGFFDGNIDDVAIFSEPLSQSQINALAGGTSAQAITGFAGAINTNIQQEMENTNASAWVRTEFGVTAGQVFDSLTLDIRYDDGFVAYLNGTKVAERNAPVSPVWNSSATAENPDASALTRETIDLTPFINLLDTGNNVLAIHGLNLTDTDGDFLIFPELSAHLAPVIDSDTVLAINEVASAQDAEFWVELSNTGTTPINLNGLVLASSEGLGGEFTLPNVEIPAGGFMVFNETTLGFGADDEDALFLFSQGKASVIDAVRAKNRLRGRLPDGSGIWQTPDVATMGFANSFDINDDIVINEIQYHARPTYATPGTPGTSQLTTLVSFSDSWRYNESGSDLGTNWFSSTHAVGGDWFSGAGPVGFEPNGTTPAIQTTLADPQANASFVTTYYFETEFNFNSGGANLADFSLNLNALIDDGAVFYLNGVELPQRINMNPGTVTAATFAFPGGIEASLTTLQFDANLLQEGSNTLAVEVHQGATNSSDVVFGLEVQLSEPLIPAIPGDPYAESTEEWIELYNRSATETIDLSNWELKDAVNFVFPLNTLLAPGEYLVIAKDPNALELKFPGTFNPGDVLGPFSGKLSNSHEAISLEDANKNIVDAVHYYDDTNWASAADGGGSSLELRDPNADNNTAEAWAASDESSRSSWQSYSYTRTVQSLVHGPPVNFHELVMGLLDEGEILIDNITVTDITGGGAIALIQNSDFELDAIGQPAASWRLVGTHDQSRVIDDPDNPGNNVLQLSAELSMGYFANRAETTLAGGAQVIDGNTYEISFDAKWISGSPQFHTELYYKDAARTTILDMPEISGTPGAQNSVFETNIGPTYSGLSQFPIVPSSSEDVTISVTATDPDGILTMRLFYEINGGGFTFVTMSAGAGGVYSADIPAQANGSIIQFYVEGIDLLGATSTFPADGADSRALYKVNNSFALDPLRQDFQILMLPAEANGLHVATEIMDNNRVGSTVIYNGNEIFYDVGTRLKGSMFSRNNQSVTGYNVQFHPDQLFRGVHETITLDQNNEQEIQALHLANQTDVLGGQYNDVVQLTTPTGSGGGPTMLGMARHGNVFLDEQFDNGSDGSLYRFEGIRVLTANNPPEALKTFQPVGWVPSFDLDDLGDDKELYRWPFLLKNNHSEDNFDELSRMAKAFSLTGSALQDALDVAIDVDQWMSTFALMSLTGIGDVYSQGNPHNLNFYVRPEDGKVLAFPWDWDFTFNRATNSPLHGGKNIAKAIDLPVNERIFYGHMLNMVDTVVNGSYMADWASHYGTMLGLGFGGTAGYLDARASFVTGAVSADFPQVSFGINTAGPLVVADTVATIEGTGWVNVREIRLFGSSEPLDVTWSVSGGANADTWSVTLPIPFGPATNYTFEAYDFQGNLIGSDIISIESTVSDRPLQDFLRVTELHYNPSVAGDATEFIELKNIGTETLDLTGVQITEGPSSPFNFTGSNVTSLAPGEFVLIVKDSTQFSTALSQYPGVSAAIIAGQFAGSLSNGGEQIKIIDSTGAIIQQFTYEDGNGVGEEEWHRETDGFGFSLVSVDTSGDYNDPTNWRSSAEVHGSPGLDDPTPLSADFDGDGEVNAADLAILLSNYGIAVGANRSIGDANHDQKVSLQDLLLLKKQFGSTISAPPPAAAAAALVVSIGQESNILPQATDKISRLANRIAAIDRSLTEITAEAYTPINSEEQENALPIRQANAKRITTAVDQVLATNNTQTSTRSHHRTKLRAHRGHKVKPLVRNIFAE